MTPKARFVTPDSADEQQALRVNRNLMAAASAALVVILLTFYWREGYLPGRAYAISVVLIAALVIGFHIVFRTRFNLRFLDPSLTFVQVSSAVVVLVYVNFNLEAGRGAFLLVYMMAMLFAVFRLTTREIFAIIVPVLVAHAALLILLEYRGTPPDALRMELIQWIVLVVVLLWFAQVAGYVSDMRRRMRALVARDDLTGAYNRPQMIDELSAEKARVDRRGGSFCVLMLDLDHFKAVNDTHGHEAGDVVLKTFADLVRAQIRPGDQLGRFGGEEFLLMLPDTALAAGIKLAERIRAVTRAADWDLVKPGLQLTVSIGVQECGKDCSVQAAVAAADAALYRAKRSGRDRVECMEPLALA